MLSQQMKSGKVSNPSFSEKSALNVLMNHSEAMVYTSKRLMQLERERSRVTTERDLPHKAPGGEAALQTMLSARRLL